jgi:tRNA(adenine34) deaminase
MALALAEARNAGTRGEVPIGAVVVRDGQVLGAAGNASIAACDPTAHAEILALRAAGCATQNYRLTGAVLYVTVEPCAMCAGAMLWARLARLVFGCRDPKAGAAGSVLDLTNDLRFNHRLACTAGVHGTECAAVLQEFFRARRSG